MELESLPDAHFPARMEAFQSARRRFVSSRKAVIVRCMMDDRPNNMPGRAAGRWMLFALGWVCVGLGIVGLVTPLMPGTVFLILAAWLFSRSSPRFEAWLITHPRLGPAVIAWRETGAVPRWAQWVATGSMAFSFGLMFALRVSVPVLAIVGAIFVGLAAYLLTRPVA